MKFNQTPTVIGLIDFDFPTQDSVENTVTAFYHSKVGALLPTVTVSFKDVTSEPNPLEKLSKPIRPRSSLTQTTAPCDICHCKAKRLFSLSQQGLIYFVCHKCYKEVCANRGKFTKNIVDLSNLVRNSQHNVKWEVIGTDSKKLTSRLNKRKRQSKKNKEV